MKWLMVLPLLCLGACGGLDRYEGPRNPEALQQEIARRYQPQSFLGVGRASLDVNDESSSFSFELRLDRQLRSLYFSGSKTLTGSLFELSSTPSQQLWAWHYDKPYYTRLKRDTPIEAFGGLTLKEWEDVLLCPWPPTGAFHEVDGSYHWGNWIFCKKTLAIRQARFDTMTWIFDDWIELKNGQIVAEEWVFRRFQDEIELDFDFGHEQSEVNFPFEKEHFEIDISTLSPLD